MGRCRCPPPQTPTRRIQLPPNAVFTRLHYGANYHLRAAFDGVAANARIGFSSSTQFGHPSKSEEVTVGDPFEMMGFAVRGTEEATSTNFLLTDI